MRVSLPLGICLLAIFCALIAACGEGAPRDKTPESPPKQDAPSDPPTEAAPAQLLTAKQCGQCHREIYAEWRASYHGRAMEDPLFRELSAAVNKEECIRCHAPVTLREAGFETPIARSDLREDAISCLSCHDTGDGMAGPHEGLSGACRPVFDPQQTDVVKMCFVCHNQHDTGNEWLRGPYSPEAPEPRLRDVQTCLDCHMPSVERPLVPGGPVRKGRRHTWFGGHSITQLRKAAELDVVTEKLPGGGHRFRVFVTNKGAGHAIPTDARHRSFDTYVLIKDAAGKVLLNPIDPQQQDRAHLAKFRKFYRGSGKSDTQIPPLARVDTLGEGPGFVDVPTASAGTGEAWLVYRLTPRDVLNKRSLEEGDPHDIKRLYRARVVIRKEFTYGP